MSPGVAPASTPAESACFFDFDDLEEQDGDSRPPAAARAAARGALRHFLTFGNGRYEAAAQRIAGEVNALGDDIFQAVHAFTELPRSVASDPRWRRHVSGGSKGYGWWFWKPALVNHLLAEGVVADGDTIAYGDAGCVVNAGSQAAWLELIHRVEVGGGVDLVAFQHGHLEYKYSKGDTFQRFGRQWDDKDYGLTCQLVGGYWVAKIGPRTRRLFKLWELLAEDTRLVSDDPPAEPNPRFIENRHDQSLLSMLVKSNMPVYERADNSHVNAARSRDDDVPTEWRSQAAAARHPEFGIEGLKVVVLKDCGWPVMWSSKQPIAAARLCGSACADAGSAEEEDGCS